MPMQNKTLAKAVRKATPESKAAMRKRAEVARAALRDKIAEGEQLTDLQANFIHEYQQDYRATAAYIRAGGAPAHASNSASALLKIPRIRKLIDEADKKRAERYAVTPENILRELSKMAFTSMEDFTVIQEDGTIVTDFSGVKGDQLAALTEIQVETYQERDIDADEEDGPPQYKTVKKVRFKLSDKRGALELLAKTQKMLVDRKELSNPDGSLIQPPAIQINFVKPPDRKPLENPVKPPELPEET